MEMKKGHYPPRELKYVRNVEERSIVVNGANANLVKKKRSANRPCEIAAKEKEFAQCPRLSPTVEHGSVDHHTLLIQQLFFK